jgi:hypothetical protein
VSRFFLLCGAVCRLVAGGLSTLRRSSHRAIGRNGEKVWLKKWDLEGSCLQLLCGVVVDGWLSGFSGLSAEGVASNAPPAPGFLKFDLN